MSVGLKCSVELSSLLVWNFPPLFSSHKSTNSPCLSPSLSLSMSLSLPFMYMKLFTGKPAEHFAPWKNIPLINLLKNGSDPEQFVQSRFVTRWNALRSSESSGHVEEVTVWNTLQGQISERDEEEGEGVSSFGLVPCWRDPQEFSEIAQATALQPSHCPVVWSKTET